MSAKTKTFTPKQLARLPDIGYWVGHYPNSESVEIFCVMNGQVKYIHHSWGKEWNTLMWTCCTTRNQIASGEYGVKWEHFHNHASMLAKHPDIKDPARVKAPNDF